MGYVINNPCCCKTCCPGCCAPGGPPAQLTATFTTDCGSYTATLIPHYYNCCDENGQPIDCVTGAFPQVNTACVEYTGVAEHVDCPVLLDAEGHYGCEAMEDICVLIRLSLLDFEGGACLRYNVHVEGYLCGAPDTPVGSASDLEGTLETCAAIDITQDLSNLGFLVVCDHGTVRINITE